MKTIKLNSDVQISNPVVTVWFDIVVDHRAWDVKGELNLMTKEFTPHLVGVFSFDQFATDVCNAEPAEMAAKLQKMVAKGLK